MQTSASTREADEPTGRDQLRWFDSGSHLRTSATLGMYAVLIGIVAGLGTFSFVQRGVTPEWVAPSLSLAVVLLSGTSVSLLIPHLKASVAVLLGAFFVGLAVHVGAWVAPLWLLEYPVVARDVLLPQYVGRAIFSAILSYPPTFIVGYLIGIVVDAYVYH